MTWERRFVNPGDLGTPVRFEIETDAGFLIRYVGEEASAYVAALNSARVMAERRGMRFPSVPPLVREGSESLDQWWHEDHFGEKCEPSIEGSVHSEECVSAAYGDGYAAGLRKGEVAQAVIDAISDEDWRAIVNECGACAEAAAFQQDAISRCERHDYLFAAIDALARITEGS